MKNLVKKSTFKAVVVCLFLAMAFATVFGFSKWQSRNRGLNVSTEQTEHDHNHDCQQEYVETFTLNYKTGEITFDEKDSSNATTSSIVIGGSSESSAIKLLKWDGEKYSEFTGDGSTFGGGSTVWLEPSNETYKGEKLSSPDEKNVLCFKNSNDNKTTYFCIISNSPICFVCYHVTNVKSGNINLSKNPSKPNTFEELDPNYTGTIKLTVEIEPRSTDLKGYYLNEDGKGYKEFVFKDAQFSADGRNTFNIGGALPEGEGVVSWHINTGHTDASKLGYKVKEGAPATLQGGENWTGALDSIWGHPHVSLDGNTANNPLIIGITKRSHQVTIENYGRKENVNDGFWSNTDSDLHEKGMNKVNGDNSLCGVKINDDSVSAYSKTIKLNTESTADLYTVSAGNAFNKSDDVVLSDKNYCGLWNYGFDFLYYEFYVSIGTTPLGYLKSSGALTSNKGEDTKITTNKISFASIANWLDALAAENGNLPTLTIYPYWAPAKIQVYTTNIDDTKNITFSEGYDLSGLIPASNDENKTFFAFQTAKENNQTSENETASENNQESENETGSENNQESENKHVLIASSGNWSYHNIDKGVFDNSNGDSSSTSEINEYESSSSEASYPLKLTCVYLDDDIAVQLSDIEESDTMELEEWTIESGKDSNNPDKYILSSKQNTSRYYKNITDITDGASSRPESMNWEDYKVSLEYPDYSSADYPIMSLYSDALKNFKTKYEEEYLNGSGLNLGQVFKYEGNYYIYLRNAQKPVLPMFKAKEKVIIGWCDNNNEKYATPVYNKEFGGLTNISESYSGGTNLTAIYANKLNLYSESKLKDNSPDPSHYNELSALYYLNNTLELNKLYLAGNEKDSDGVLLGKGLTLGKNDYTFGGWIFNADVARNANNNYFVNFDSGTLTAEKDGQTTTFNVTQIGDSEQYYIHSVAGAPFVQDASDPIITVKWNRTYDFTFDNESAEYWKGLDQIDSNLYGATSQNGTSDASNSGFETTIKVSAYEGWYSGFRFMTTELENIGVAFASAGAILSNNIIPTSTHEHETDQIKYAVYNYGHRVTGYYISFSYEESTVYVKIGGDNKFAADTSSNKIVNKIEIGNLNNENTLNKENTTLDDLAAFIDDYLIANGNKYTPATVTITPTWAPVSIQSVGYTLTNKSGSAPVTFGTAYTISGAKEVKDDKSQSLFAYSHNGQLIARSGVWNYKTIYLSDNDRSAGFVYNSGVYEIEFKADYVDNFLPVTLNGLDDCDYSVVNGKLADRTYYKTTEELKYISFENYYTYLVDECGLSSDYKYCGEHNEVVVDPLIDDYIATLTENKAKFESELNNSNSKIETSAIYKLIIGYNNGLYVYIANNHKPILPMFKDGLSQTVYWKNDSSYYKPTTNLIYGDYSGEVDNKDKIDNPSTWNCERSKQFTAVIVYSIDLYYNTPDNMTEFKSINTSTLENDTFKQGYFGKTLLDLYDENKELKILPSEDGTITKEHASYGLCQYKCTNTTPGHVHGNTCSYGNDPYRIFDCWMIDTSKLEKNAGYNTHYADGILTITKGSGENKDTWEFNVVGKNKYSNNIFYVSGINYATAKFKQNPGSPIVLAKWANLYDLTMDNSTAEYWSTFKDNSGQKKFNNGTNLSLYYAKSHTDDDNRYPTATTFKTANHPDFECLTFISSEGKAEGKALGKAFSSTTSIGDTLQYQLQNYGHYITGYHISINVNGKTIGFMYNNGEWSVSDNIQNSKTSDIDQLNEPDSSTNMKELAFEVDEYLAQHSSYNINITVIPKWKGAKIKAVHADNENVLFNNENGAVEFGSKTYTINDSVSTPIKGQSIMAYYYGSTENDHLIAKSAYWNYKKINSANFTYENNSGKLGAGVYTIKLTPIYVDNIYQVNLAGCQKSTSSSYILEQTGYEFNSSTGSEYRTNDANRDELKYYDDIHNGIHNGDGFDYNYSSFDYNKNPLVDDYIGTNDKNDNEYYIKYHNKCLASWIEIYKTGISTGVEINGDNKGLFSCLEKVYYLDGTRDDGDPRILNVDASTNVTMFTYLVNAQSSNNLPIFKNDYNILILWKNAPTDNNDTSAQYAYKTLYFDETEHADDAGDVKFHGEDNDCDHKDCAGKWYYADANNSNLSVTLNAHYFRKYFFLNVNTIMDRSGSPSKERRGFVTVELDDLLHENEPDLVQDRSHKYLFVFDYDSKKMKIYSYIHEFRSIESYEHEYSKFLLGDLDGVFTELREGEGFVRYNTFGDPILAVPVYAGCSIKMHVFDQSQDPDAMKTGHYDDMIGYKFSGTILQTYTPYRAGQDDEKDGLFANNGNEYVTTIYPIKTDESPESTNGNYIIDKDYDHRSLVSLDVVYERIKYTLGLDIDLAYQSQDFWSGYLKFNEIDIMKRTEGNQIRVEDKFDLYYYSYAGFKLQEESFVLINNKFQSMLQQYAEDQVELAKQQRYIIQLDNMLEDGSLEEGTNIYQSYKRFDGSFDGTWLRTHYYQHIENPYLCDDSSSIVLGVLTVKTAPILFNFGLKIYDSTDTSGSDGIIATKFYDQNNTIQYNYFEDGDNKTKKEARMTIYEDVLFLSQDLGFWYYSLNNINYAVLNSRLYFPGQATSETANNFKSRYDFLCTTYNDKTRRINSVVIINMVTEQNGYVYKDGEIIPLNFRNLYLMFEVRKLYKINLEAEQLTGDSNITERITTISNGTNNSVGLLLNSDSQTRTEIIVEATQTTPAITRSVYVDTQKIYTYYGCENRLQSIYNDSAYQGVEYYLNKSTGKLDGTMFTLGNGDVDANNEAWVTIKFIPKGLDIEYVYYIDGSLQLSTEIVDKLIDQTKPSRYKNLAQGTKFDYKLSLIDPTYVASVSINSAEQGLATKDSKTIELSHTVSPDDAAIGKIVITVNLNGLKKGYIQLRYNLIDNRTPIDGEYAQSEVSQVLDGTKTTITEETSGYRIIEGGEILVLPKLEAGYYYAGKVAFGAYNAVEVPIVDGLINILDAADNINGFDASEGFDADKASGVYVIYIAKTPIVVQMSQNGVISNSEYKINGSQKVEDLYVNASINFSATEVDGQRFDYYYYIDNNNQQNKYSDNKNVSNQIIDKDLLNNVFGADFKYSAEQITIKFGVKTVNTYKAEFTINGKEFLSEFAIQIDGTKAPLNVQHDPDNNKIVKYATTYYDENSELTFAVKTIINGKYHIIVQTQGGYQFGSGFEKADNYDEITFGNISIRLTENHSNTIVIEPYSYTAQIISESVYETLKDIDENKPTVVTSQGVNNLQSAGLRYGSTTAYLTFVRATSDRELKRVYISGNDMDVELCVEFNQATFKVFKKDATGKFTEPVDLKIYDLTIENLSTPHIKMSFTSKNDIQLKFEYVLYKSISF